MKYLLLGLLSLTSVATHAAKLDLLVSNITGGPGAVFYAVIADPGQFPDGKTVASGSVAVNGKQTEVKISLDLPAGSYAISTFLDENQNKKLDKRLGIPSERFEFSNNPKLKFGPPSFHECEIRVQEGVRNSTSIQEKYFKNHLGI